MRRIAVLLCICSMFATYAFASQTAPSGLVLKPGIYRTKWVVPAEGRDIRRLAGTARLHGTMPPRLTTVPKLASANPRYGLLELDALLRDVIDTGDEKLVSWGYETVAEMPFTLDESKGTGKGYDTIYVDVNMNGSLKDEHGLSARAIDGELVCYGVAIIPHSRAYPRSKNRNHLAIDVFLPIVNGAVTEGRVYYRGAWVGQISSNGGGIPFMLFDDNGNGLYNDPVVITDEFSAEGGDYILFDFGRSGRFPEFGSGTQATGLMDYHPVMNIGGKLYAPKPSVLGDKLDLQPYKGAAGKARLQVSPINAVPVRAGQQGVGIYAGSQVYLLPADGSAIAVPAASYNMQSVALLGKQKTGPDLRLLYYSEDTLKVVRNETAQWKVGGALKMAISPYTDELEGRTGETDLLEICLLLGRGYLTCDPRDLKDSPTLTITSSSGKLVHTAKAGDAGGLTTAFVSHLPATLKPGRYTVSASWKNSPFGPIQAERMLIVR